MEKKISEYEWLRQDLASVGRDQKWLAYKTGITEAHISRIFNGLVKRPSYMTIKLMEGVIELEKSGAENRRDNDKGKAKK